MRSALGHLPRLLRLLADFPHPDIVARALADGPLSEFGAIHATILVPRENALVTSGVSHAMLADLTRFEAYPLNLDLPVVKAFTTAETQIVPMQQIWKLPAARAYRNLETDIRADPDVGVFVTSVITCGGSRVGAWWAVCKERQTWGSTDHALISAVSAALGIWLTHPDSGITDVISQRPNIGMLHLTPRQQEVLLMVEHGKTNAAIAAALGFSQSTIKLELHRILETLRTATRESAAVLARSYGLLPDRIPSDPEQRTGNGGGVLRKSSTPRRLTTPDRPSTGKAARRS